MKNFLMPILLFLPILLFAQRGNNEQCLLVGSVYDSFTRIPLPAKIILMTQDSVVLDTTSVKIYGHQNNYAFKVQKETRNYIIKATCIGYDSCYINYQFKPRSRNQNYEIPPLLLRKKNKDYTVDLDGIEVKATRIQLVYRGDTLIYDASAFVLPEGSMLDNLIKQMPGAELKDNGDVYINGQKVDYLTLNGKNFFKGKNKVMLENLPYYSVKNIKVYHKDNQERLASNTRKKDYVMDVNLKREYLHSYLGNAEVGAGTDKRWLARTFGLFTGEHNNVGVFTNMNNTNEDRKPGRDGNWQSDNKNKGIKSIKQAGINIDSSAKNKKADNSFDATAQWTDDDLTEQTNRETFASDGNITKGSYNVVRNKDVNLNLNNRLMLTTKNPTFITTQVNYAKGDYNSLQKDSTYRTTWLNQRLYSKSSTLKEFKANLDIIKFFTLSNGDNLGIHAKVGYTTRKPDEAFSSERIRYTGYNTSDLRAYYRDNHRQEYNYSLSLQYDYNLNSKWTITSKVLYQQKHQTATNRNYKMYLSESGDWNNFGTLPSAASVSAQQLDSKNSYHFNSLNRQLTPSLNITRNLKNGLIEMYLPLELNREQIHYHAAELDMAPHRQYVKFEPALSYRTYGKKSIRMSYETTEAQPEYIDLMPYSNTINPLTIVVNNPLLKRQRQHLFEVYHKWKSDSTDLNRWINIRAEIVQHAWGNRINYNTKLGSFTTMMDNVDGNWNINGRIGFTRTVDRPKRLYLTMELSNGYIHSVDYDIAYDSKEATLSHVNTWHTELATSLKYTLSNLTASVQGKINSRLCRGNRNNFENLNTFDFQYGTSLQYNIPGIRLSMNTDLTMFSHRGYESSMMNTDNLIWNAQISHSLIKERVTAKLSVFDMLHQFSNKTYLVNAQGWTETYYNSIPRYIMFSLIFKFHKGKGN